MENRHHFKYVIWLNEVGKQDLLLVGGKGANLGVLLELGFPVPCGFCLTTEAFHYFAKKINLESKVIEATSSLNIADYQQLRNASHRLRYFICTKRIPVVIEREILEAYQILSENKEQPAWVAVRSSATLEDLPEISFAGQLETYLNLRGAQNVKEAVLKCWAALFTERVIAYRGNAGFNHMDASMGVVIQEMVDASKSGVMFTIHPVTEDHSKILIEATIGLGEALVGGAATPDTYLVDKLTLDVVEQHAGSKKRVVLRNPVGGGVIKIETPQGQERKPCLTTEEVRRIAEFGRRIETEYNNTPQDIEWAISNNLVYILQTRPVTGL